MNTLWYIGGDEVTTQGILVYNKRIYIIPSIIVISNMIFGGWLFTQLIFTETETISGKLKLEVGVKWLMYKWLSGLGKD